jgi:hypothetical protein
MKPADLREFAEKLYVSAPRHAEFAKEILDLLDLVAEQAHEDLVAEIETQGDKACKGKTPMQTVEYLGDRDSLLMDIEDMIPEYEERLEMAEIDFKNVDVDDVIRALFERLPTEYDL